MSHPFHSLPENLAAFCAELRRHHGFRVGPLELQDAARALEITPLLEERAVRNALRPVLSHTHENTVVFDEAFERFFRVRRGVPQFDQPSAARHPRAEGDAAGRSLDRHLPQDAGMAGEAVDQDLGHDARGAVTGVSDEGRVEAARVIRGRYSPLAAGDEGPQLMPADRAWRDAAAALVNRVHAGLSRRWRPAPRGARFDLRRTLRSSFHTGGELVVARWRARPRRRARFILLIDGSRSMIAHVQPALQTATALASVTREVETFTFSTSLRRITHEVRRAAAGERRRLVRLHEAWGGGTRIGASLQEFHRAFGERLLGPGTVVIVASDGLDVGEPEALRDAMRRLRQGAAAVVWLNPLVELPGYEPTARGMSIARPFVTSFTWVGGAPALLRLSRTLRIRA